MNLQEQFEKETGNVLLNHFSDFDKYVYWKNFAEWLESRVPQWISVKDNPPKTNGFALVFNVKKGIGVTEFINSLPTPPDPVKEGER